MNGQLNRLGDLEGRFERLRLDVQALQTQMAMALQQIRDQQQGGGGGSSGATPVYWTMNTAAVGPATTTGASPADITPATFTGNIYVDQGGTLTQVASGATVRSFYLDTIAANSLIPVEPAGDQMAWNTIAAGCTTL